MSVIKVTELTFRGCQVGVVWCIEFIHQTLVAHTVYHYLVLCFGSPIIIILTEPLVWSFVPICKTWKFSQEHSSMLYSIVWPKPILLQIVQTLIVVSTVSGSIVKFCSIIRIWRFSNHNIMVTAALSMVVFAQIGWILGDVMCHLENQNTNASPKKVFEVRVLQLQNALGLASIKDVASGALATGALGDILLALAMCYYLRKWRTGYQEPDSLLNRLVHYALNTGIMTSTRKQVIGEVGDEFTQTNDGLGSLTTIPELARNVNVNPVEVNVQHETGNAGDQAYEVFDGHGSEKYLKTEHQQHNVQKDSKVEFFHFIHDDSLPILFHPIAYFE
ncbi:hypothetical protein F5051DRAFT_432326 [Lentinula edodes]|nr:hypothetical protein F5051DRAFT_432326 [Lentinula edodes]